MNAIRHPDPSIPRPVPSTLVSAKEACNLLPSHQPGKRLVLSTIYRWIYSGRLPAVKRGKFWFVDPVDVFALNVPTLPTQITPATKVPDETVASLVKQGIMAVTPEERERLEKRGLLERTPGKSARKPVRG